MVLPLIGLLFVFTGIKCIETKISFLTLIYPNFKLKVGSKGLKV